MDDDQLRTVWLQRQLDDRSSLLGPPLREFMKHTLARRVRRLAKLAEIWDEVVPQAIRDHTALEGLQNGLLTVMVDSAAHRFQLQTLLTGGLTREIRQRFGATLHRIKLIPGQFYSVDLTGQRRYEP